MEELLPRCRARIPALGVTASKRRYRPSPVTCACMVRWARVALCDETQNQQKRGNAAEETKTLRKETQNAQGKQCTDNTKTTKLRKNQNCVHDLVEAPWASEPANQPAASQPGQLDGSATWRSCDPLASMQGQPECQPDVFFLSRQHIASRGVSLVTSLWFSELLRVSNRTAAVAAKGTFALVHIAHVREMVQMRPPCFAAG